MVNQHILHRKNKTTFYFDIINYFINEIPLFFVNLKPFWARVDLDDATKIAHKTNQTDNDEPTGFMLGTLNRRQVKERKWTGRKTDRIAPPTKKKKFLKHTFFHAKKEKRWKTARTNRSALIKPPKKKDRAKSLVLVWWLWIWFRFRLLKKLVCCTAPHWATGQGTGLHDCTTDIIIIQGSQGERKSADGIEKRGWEGGGDSCSIGSLHTHTQQQQQEQQRRARN